LGALLAILLGAGCATTPPPKPGAIRINLNPYPSTYRPYGGVPTLIRGATVLDGEGGRIDNGSVLLVDGKVQAVGGADLAAPEGATVIDAQGRYVTPGIIDIHSHLGDYPSPGVESLSDGNEATSPARPEVWAEHSVWPQDPGFSRALANGGITSLQILPGSANLFGGRSVVLKNVPARTVQGMKFPGAPYGLKMACGENPKRVYGSKGQMPQTRMGNIAYARQTWIRAKEYDRKWTKYEKTGGEIPAQDLAMETLRGVLHGQILVHNHCYRADEMALMIDMSKEFGYKISTFHHGVEAYKVADRLAAEGVCGALWADWWGFKMESLDGIEVNLALVDRPSGGCAIVHSDSSEGIQRLNQEAAKAMAHAKRIGLDIPPERAIRWLTANPARALGIDRQTGTLEPGKMGDAVLWNGTPFSVYAHAEKVWVDGTLLYDRADRSRQPQSDFLVGQGVSP
jgi:imidazolonepropionase-like amidohydrolase